MIEANANGEFNVVSRVDGTHAVVNEVGEAVASGFASNAAAWAWIDRHTFEGRTDTDRANRIRNSVNFSS